MPVRCFRCGVSLPFRFKREVGDISQVFREILAGSLPPPLAGVDRESPTITSWGGLGVSHHH